MVLVASWMQHLLFLLASAVSAEVSPVSSVTETMCNGVSSTRSHAVGRPTPCRRVLIPIVAVHRVQTQFIAADPGMKSGASSSGEGASEWGIWRLDPGPRGVRLSDYAALADAGGVAPRGGWKFDREDWWLEEHGLIMEKPEFPIQSGKYMCARHGLNS